MNYKAALAYVDQFIDYERSPDFARQTRLYNLNRISMLLDRLGNPQNRLRVVHVAGSKGKGSTAALIASVLRCAGYKTGLFTSPHLITPRERCRIDGHLISEEDVTLYILEKLKSAIEIVSDSQFGRVTFFEIYTALAFCYFADKGVDFAVVEVGLGGRLDATNVVSPVTTVITPIGLEHTAILGETYADIAAEKAEIIKTACPVAFAPQHPEAQAVLENRATTRNAPIVSTGTISNCQLLNGTGANNDFIDVKQGFSSDTLIGQQFDLNTESDNYLRLTIPFLGQHQLINAATAIAGIECLLQQGYDIPKTSIYDGFKQARWPGRMQIIREASIAPSMVLLDGAHSPVSMKALCGAIQESFRYEHLIFIVSLMRDKDLTAIGEIISQTADSVIATQVSADNPRVMPAETIRDAWQDMYKKVTVCPTPEQAIATALAAASPATLVCITGSLYLVGEALKVFRFDGNWDRASILTTNCIL